MLLHTLQVNWSFVEFKAQNTAKCNAIDNVPFFFFFFFTSAACLGSVGHQPLNQMMTSRSYEIKFCLAYQHLSSHYHSIAASIVENFFWILSPFTLYFLSPQVHPMHPLQQT
jgi:hypothetical protein